MTNEKRTGRSPHRGAKVGLALGVVVLLVLGACSSQGTPSKADLIDVFLELEGGAVDESQAACFADVALETFSETELEGMGNGELPSRGSENEFFEEIESRCDFPGR